MVVAGPLRGAEASKTSQSIEPARKLTLNEALRLALEYNPEIGRLETKFADMLARAIEAETKINPHFKITAGSESADGNTGGSFETEAEQPLRPSDFRLRQTYAVALHAAANVEQQADVLGMLNRTAVLYYRAWSLQERISLLSRSRDEASDVVQMLAEQDETAPPNIFQAEEARLNAELLAARSEAASAQLELQRLTGLASAEFQLSRPAFEALPDSSSLALFARRRARLRRLALAREAAALSGVQAAEADAVFPTFAPASIYTYDGAAVEDGSQIATGGRAIFDRKQRPSARAEAALHQSEHHAAANPATMKRLIVIRRRRVVDTTATVSTARNNLVRANRAYTATLEQFRAGQATTLQLFAVYKRLTRSRDTAYHAEIEALSARTKLEHLIGGRIEEVSAELEDRRRTEDTI